MGGGEPGLPPRLDISIPGTGDFVLQQSETLTDWKPLATVFSRLETFRIGQLRPGADLPAARAAYYRAFGKVETPAEMAEAWRTRGFKRYRFTFSRTCFCAPRVLTGRVTVDEGRVTAVDDAQGNGPIPSPNLSDFLSVEQLFELMESSRATADLVQVQMEPELHFPKRLDILWNSKISDAGFTYEVTDLVPIE